MDNDCTDICRMDRVDSPADSVDWSGLEGYSVYRCVQHGDIWGWRYQYDSYSGDDDRWHNFGKVDPQTIKRHYQ